MGETINSRISITLIDWYRRHSGLGQKHYENIEHIMDFNVIVDGYT